MRVGFSIIKSGFIFSLTVFFILLFTAACRNNQTTGEVKSSVLPASQPSLTQESATPDSVPDLKKLPDNYENKLIGKWIRSDGGYTVEVFSAGKDGKLDAGYFNPNPIHVDKAEWKISENILYMRIILKDINYPGSTYVLMYNPENETLAGNYFQAIEKTNYDVIFTRKK